MIQAYFESVRLDKNPIRALIQLGIDCNSCKKKLKEVVECRMFGTIHVGCQDCGEKTNVRYDPDTLREFTQRCLKANPLPPQDFARAMETLDEFVDDVIEESSERN